MRVQSALCGKERHVRLNPAKVYVEPLSLGSTNTLIIQDTLQCICCT
jgi:hypothetical protein